MKIILGIAVLAALLSIGRFTLISTRQLTHPVDVLNESPTVNTALLLNKGVNIYAQGTYDAPPFNLTMYTPLYFAVVSSVPGFSDFPFTTGRAVSLFFMICSLSLLVLPFRSRVGLLFGIVGIGWLLLFRPFLINAAFFRMQTMALFFSVCAVVVLRKNQPTFANIALAAFFAFLGVMSKQSYIAAPGASFLLLLWRNRPRAFQFAALFCALIGLSFYLLNEWSEGGFLWSILVAPRYSLSLDWFLDNFAKMRTPAFNFLIVTSSLACYSMMRVPTEGKFAEHLQESWRCRLSGIYFLTSWFWVLATIGKVGANPNYFIEPLFSSVWLLLTWVNHQGKSPMGTMIGHYVLAALPVFFAWDAIVTRAGMQLFLPQMHPPKQFEHVRDEMQSLGIPPSPKILNLANHRISLSIGWDLHVNDTFWYAVLWNTRTLSNQSLVRAIDQGYYDLIVLKKGTRPTSISDPTPLGEIHLKIFERYELKIDNYFAYYVRRGSR